MSAPPDDDNSDLDTDRAGTADAFLREAARASAAAPPESFAQDLVGKTVARYRIVSVLGRGGMGVVYLADDPSLGRRVALKVLPSERLGDRERRHRFLREARMGAAATHPNIATVYEVGEAEGHVFLAMEHVVGTTLRARLDGGPLPTADVIRIGAEIARGVAKAHEAGVVHRDLKPENIMLGDEDHVKILDFGLGKQFANDLSAPARLESMATDLATEEGHVLGTPHYMSPEQAMGRPVDERTDIFSLGVVLYEMATGRRPFHGATSMELLVAIGRDEPPPVSTVNPAVPTELASVIARCLRKNPNDRLASCRELVSELRRVGGGAPDLPSDPGSRSRAGAARPKPPEKSVDPTVLQPPAPRALAQWLAPALLVAVAAGILGGLGVLGVNAYRAHAVRRAAPAHSSSSTGATASPLSTTDSILACPIFEASGVDEPSGWLGAATADMACRRANIFMGGRHERMLLPAELLDLPRAPIDTFPRDPYVEPNARARTLAAAKQRAPVHLDGRIVVDHAVFRVTLAMKTRDGRELAKNEASSAVFYQAVRAAMEPLVRPDAIPRASGIDHQVARFGVADVDLALILQDFGWSMQAGAGIEQELANIEAHRAELAPEWIGARRAAASALGEPLDAMEAARIDRSSTGTLVRTLRARELVSAASGSGLSALDDGPGGRSDDFRALAEDLRTRATSTSAVERRAIQLAEAMVWQRAGERVRARTILLSVLPDDPAGPWGALASLSYRMPGFGTEMRTYAGWAPHTPEAWGLVSFADDDKDDHPLRVRRARRAVVLAPDVAIYSMNLANVLVNLELDDEARSIAARLALGGRSAKLSSELLVAYLEASEGQMGAALARARPILLGLQSYGSLGNYFPEYFLVTFSLDLANILGRAQPVADEIVKHFLEADPPRVAKARLDPAALIYACALASRPTADRGIARMRTLIAKGWFDGVLYESTRAFLDGAERYAHGEYRAAAGAWRGLADSTYTGYSSWLLADAFERGGEPALAERSEGAAIKRLDGMSFKGLRYAHVQAARRADMRGDKARARALAQQIVDLWTVNDEPVPAVVEMRTLLGR